MGIALEGVKKYVRCLDIITLETMAFDTQVLGSGTARQHSASLVLVPA
jgi:hypothetical protein